MIVKGRELYQSTTLFIHLRGALTNFRASIQHLRTRAPCAQPDMITKTTTENIREDKPLSVIGVQAKHNISENEERGNIW
jgi:hypothetical protein